MGSGPLEGIRVLEFSLVVAGPFAGVALAQLGADVVKIEPPGGEERRNTGAVVPHEGKYFQALNVGKRSLTVDLSKPEGRALIHRIVPSFDVVISNYRLGVTGRLGIDYETLRALRPDLIYAAISGFGESGPSASRGGSDIVAQAYSGLMAAEGKVDEYGAPAAIASTTYADRGTALAAVIGIVSALYHRERTGEGQEINVSLVQTALALISDKVMHEPVHDATLRDPIMQRVLELRDAGAPYEEQLEVRRGVLRTRTAQRLYYCGYNTTRGAIVLGALTKQNRERIRAIIGLQDDLDDPDYDANAPGAVERFEGWRAQVQEIMLTKTSTEWVDLFLAQGVPATEVNFPEEMFADPHVVATEMMVDLDHPITGHQQVVAPLMKMSATPTSTPRSAPPLGYHSREVLLEGGLSEDEIATLIADGVVGDRA
ncbi:MAG: CoA transferase [Dehalococcoidia bacterium]